jgi:hypothetical protein
MATMARITSGQIQPARKDWLRGASATSGGLTGLSWDPVIQRLSRSALNKHLPIALASMRLPIYLQFRLIESNFYRI